MALGLEPTVYMREETPCSKSSSTNLHMNTLVMVPVVIIRYCLTSSDPNLNWLPCRRSIQRLLVKGTSGFIAKADVLESVTVDSHQRFPCQHAVAVIAHA